MKKIRIYPTILLLLAIISAICLFNVNFSLAKETNSDINLPKGIHAEVVDDMIHQVEYHYGDLLVFSLESMLENKSIEVYPEDQISYFPDPKFGIGSQIIIKRANQVIVNDGGEEKTYRTWVTNVKDLLGEKNIEIGEMDIINPSLDQSFSELVEKSDRDVVARDGRPEINPVITKINITRVAMTEMKEYESIGYKTITKKDANLERGQVRVEQYGKKGQKELVYEVRRENGQEVERKLTRTEIVQEPVEKIIIEGTKVITLGQGTATWYNYFGGMTAAHNTLPHGTWIKVINTQNGKSVVVKIVDHGIKGSAIIDLSDDAFQQLAPLGKGRIPVRIEKL